MSVIKYHHHRCLFSCNFPFFSWSQSTNYCLSLSLFVFHGNKISSCPRPGPCPCAFLINSRLFPIISHCTLRWTCSIWWSSHWDCVCVCLLSLCPPTVSSAQLLARILSISFNLSLSLSLILWSTPGDVNGRGHVKRTPWLSLLYNTKRTRYFTNRQCRRR